MKRPDTRIIGREQRKETQFEGPQKVYNKIIAQQRLNKPKNNPRKEMVKR